MRKLYIIIGIIVIIGIVAIGSIAFIFNSIMSGGADTSDWVDKDLAELKFKLPQNLGNGEIYEDNDTENGNIEHIYEVADKKFIIQVFKNDEDSSLWDENLASLRKESADTESFTINENHLEIFSNVEGDELNYALFNAGDNKVIISYPDDISIPVIKSIAYSFFDLNK